MAPNHQVTLGHKLHETLGKAKPNTEDEYLEIEKALVSETDVAAIPSSSAATAEQQEPYLPLKWYNIIFITLFHIVGIYGAYVAFFVCSWSTFLWSVFYGQLAGLGITAGIHRFWSHRSYKANVPLRIILSILFSMTGQNKIYDWVRDHRVHHKYSETNADPHNVKKGMFFAHIGWLMRAKHPDVIEQGKKIDMSDILADPVVQFHEKYFLPMKLVWCFILPTLVPHYFWGETWYNSFFAMTGRYLFSLNITWLVNSAAHSLGSRPYDKAEAASENTFVAMVAVGEGWHNYHHVFPWDYKTSELGDYGLNHTTAIIDFFAWLGWAYDLKTATPDIIKRRKERTGDGSHSRWGTVGGEEIIGEEHEDKKSY